MNNKKRKTALLLTAVIACSAMAGCFSNNTTEVEGSDVNAESQKTASVVTIAPATEELKSSYASFEEVEGDAAEYTQYVIIATNVAIKDFRIIEVCWEEEDEKTLPVEGEVLYVFEELLPEKPLLIGVSFPGDMPTMGITYVDENNAIQYFTIVMSGEDGTIFFSPF